MQSFTQFFTPKYLNLSIGLISTERDLDNILDGLVPIRLTNVVCAGNETSLSDCSFDGVNGDPTCTHADDVIIRCFCKFA